MNTAKIYSCTVVHTASAEFQNCTPYVCAVVELEDGSRVAGRIKGYEEDMHISIGQCVYPSVEDPNMSVFTFQPEMREGTKDE